jgi:hypothetical protein
MALGSGLFEQSDLELRIWFNDGANGFEVLDPAQPLTASPYALRARSLDFDGLTGTYTGAVFFNNPANAFSGSGAGLTSLNASQLASGTVPDGRLSANVSLLGSSISSSEIDANSFNTTFWRVGGNSGTSAGTHFLGTTDAEPLDLRVNNQRALRLEPHPTSPNLIGGFSGNWVGAGNVGSTIGGGGILNNSNAVHSHYSTIAGGWNNNIGTNSSSSAIGGGENNNVADNSSASTIAGGRVNDIGTNSNSSAIGGGSNNEVGNHSRGSAIGGGLNHDVADNAPFATIPGGFANHVGPNATNAFAAGNRARAMHPGAFVWADSQNATFESTANNQVNFRCQGGVRFTTGVNGPNQHVTWVPGSASWSFSSDRNLKENLQSVDAADVLERVNQLPLHEWNYIGYEQRHVGPMAQDFHTAFPWSGDDRTLNTADLDGVALAAIQGLNQKLETELKQKQTEITELKARLEKLEQLLNRELNGGAL